MKNEIAERAMLEHHLEYNHFPSIKQYLPIAEQAIEAAREGELHGKIQIDLLKFPGFKNEIEVSKIIEVWHLEFFIQEYYDEFGEFTGLIEEDSEEELDV